jgi:N-acetylglucosamine-6-phosphate deacetylase
MSEGSLNETVESIVIRGADVVRPEGVVREHLRIEDGRFVEYNGDEGAKIFDLSGLTLYPGFIDIHNHGAVGVDTMDADPDSLRFVGIFLARNGVTGWLPTLVPGPDAAYSHAANVVAQVMADAAPTGARPLGLHYEGPFVNAAQCGALRPPFFKTFEAVGDLEPLVEVQHPEAVHLMTLAPEVSGGISLIKTMRERGWVLSIGHTRADVPTLDRACAAGACHMTHFFNAMTPMHHRSPGPVAWGLYNDRITCDVIADGHHCDPFMLKLLVKTKTPDRVSLISDSVMPTGLGDGEYDMWGETVVVRNGRTENEKGSIAGSVITLGDAVKTALSLGFEPVDVARMAAANPARLLGLDDRTGSLENGKYADIAALDANGAVRMTMVRGHLVFSGRS